MKTIQRDAPVAIEERRQVTTMDNPVYPTPQAAEAAFYNAFERADLRAMMAVWADEDNIICIHPTGPRLHGRRAVEEGWRSLFRTNTSMRFQITDIRAMQHDTFSVRSVYENIDHGSDFQQHALIISTNLYRLTDQGWRMIMHHASPGTVLITQPTARPHSVH